MRTQVRSPLSMDQRVHRSLQPQVLLPLHGLHGVGMPLHHDLWIRNHLQRNISGRGEKCWWEAGTYFFPLFTTISHHLRSLHHDRHVPLVGRVDVVARQAHLQGWNERWSSHKSGKNQWKMKQIGIVYNWWWHITQFRTTFGTPPLIVTLL